MNDDTLDREIRSGLVALVDRANEPAPFPADAAAAAAAARTAAAGTVDDGPLRRHDARRVRHLSIAAALVAAVVGLGLWVTRGDGTGIDAVHDAPVERRGFDGWAPGWHTIDPGPVTAMNGAQLSWTGSRLVVAGHHYSPTDGAATQVFAFEPVTSVWTELPRPPREITRVVAADDVLVAVGYDDRFPEEPVHEWATLVPGADAWISHGPVPVSPLLVQAGVASGGGGARERLVWTGERVIDVGLGAVLDPAAGTSSELPLPADVVAYSHLVGATPVWTGERLVLASWSQRPGLSWDATGGDRREVPGPVEQGLPPSTGSAAAATTGGDVVLVGEGTASVGYGAVWDPATGGWTALPDIPGPSSSTCPYRAEAVGRTPVVQPCSDRYETPLRLLGGAWRPIDPPPFTENCCMGNWLGIDDALIMWSTDVDTLNNPRAPYVEGAVWIPPGEAASGVPPADAAPGTDEWQDLPAGPADGRVFPVFEWAGGRLVIWGGETASEVEWSDTGAIYDPATRTWSDMSDGPLSPRSEASAAWTGTELFICCGRSPGGDDETGAAAYDPTTDRWRELPPAPTTVAFGTALWTGSEVLVVGPGQVGFPDSATVAMTFDPATDEWRQLDAPPATLGLEPHVSWTGEDAVVWSHRVGAESTGYVLDVGAGTWAPLPAVPDHLALDTPSMVATGTEVLLWGPVAGSPTTSAGAVLDRRSNQWSAMADDPLDHGEDWNGVPGSQRAVWTGHEMVIWSGSVAAPQPQLGTRIIAYRPATDTWRELDRSPATSFHPPLALGGERLAVGTNTPSLLAIEPPS